MPLLLEYDQSVPWVEHVLFQGVGMLVNSKIKCEFPGRQSPTKIVECMEAPHRLTLEALPNDMPCFSILTCEIPFPGLERNNTPRFQRPRRLTSL